MNVSIKNIYKYINIYNVYTNRMMGNNAILVRNNMIYQYINLYVDLYISQIMHSKSMIVGCVENSGR